MRVISGEVGGRRLQTPEDFAVRPTTDKVKEALFSSLQFEIEGARVLDLFSGSGQLGIEALSRGAESAVFVDNSKQSIALTKKNLSLCSLNAQVILADSVSYIEKSEETFDIVFLDPPYLAGILQKVLPSVSEHMSESGVIVAESPFGEELPEKLNNSFELVKQKKYGSMQLSFYRKR